MAGTLQYTNFSLNRSDSLRQLEDQIQILWQQADTRLVPLHQNKNLIDDSGNAIFASQSELHELGIKHNHGTLLGIESELAYFAVHCNDEGAQGWTRHFQGAEFTDLRVVGAALSGREASILACARGLVHWQQSNRFCSQCGGINKLISAGHTLQCAECSTQNFPRTDPAVIMLVEHTDSSGNKKCLLGRSPAWARECYSTLAGFVEVGETLEAAVIREVYEEAGVVVTDPIYVASQPWPFPQSIMLGFSAMAQTTEIVLDRNELAEAHWFTVDEVAGFGEWTETTDGPKLPRRDSIARLLIDRWVSANA